jgi:hypothetical protein
VSTLARGLALVVALLLCLPAQAAELRLLLDRTDLTEGQVLPLVVELVDGSVRGVPQVPVGTGLRIRYEGQSQSTVIRNFQASSTKSYTHALTAIAPGRWKIGPVRVEVGGETLVAGPIEVVVGPRADPGQTGTRVVASFSEPRPFVGQTVLHILEFRRDVPVVGVDWSPPDFEGFVAEAHAKPLQRDHKEEVGGSAISVEEVLTPLVAVSAGVHAVPAIPLRVQFPTARRTRSRDPMDRFFGRQSVRVETFAAPATTVEVRPLPSVDIPADHSGLVGKFRVDVEADQTRLSLGDSATVVVRVTGTGTLSGFRLPSLPADADFRVYDDATEVVSAIQDGRFLSQATVNRAIVPDVAGRLVMPPVELTVFDPEVERFVSVKSRPLVFDVAPGDGKTGQVESFGPAASVGGVVEALGEDILSAPTQTTAWDQSLGASLSLLVALPALPVIWMAGGGLWGWRRRRQARPWVTLQGELGSLPGESSRRMAALEDIFRRAVGLHLGVPPASVTAESLAPLGEDARAAWVAISAIRYGGAEAQDVEQAVRHLVAELSP